MVLPPTLHIRRAVEADAEALSAFAASTFRDTFSADNSPEDMARYLTETFTPDRQRGELRDPSRQTLLVEPSRPDHPVGMIAYAHLVAGASPPAVVGPAPIELRRFYVARDWHGLGIAQSLMEAVLAAARSSGAGTLWLGVWERNARAIAFYEKSGFTCVGTHRFVLGTDQQTDWLLARPI